MTRTRIRTWPRGRARAGWLGRLPEQIETALAYLSAIDPEAFEIAFTAVTAAGDGVGEDEVPVPACRRCGALIGIFPDRDFRGDSVTSGVQEVYEPGHTAQVSWILAAEDQQEL
jgi:hypothetical protein